MRRYAYRLNYTWSPALAYVIGLIASDGCLYSDGRHINLTSTDISQLETVRGILNLRGSVKTKPNGFGGLGYYIQFSNVSLYDFVFNAGVKPAKSKTITKIILPDMFYRDFLRGFFDGDGSVYGFWDKRWQNSLMYYTEFTCASLSFLLWLQEQNSRLAKVTKGTTKVSTGAYKLSYAKANSKLLYDFMYYSSDIPALERKRSKFIDFLKRDPYASKVLREWRNPVDALD